MALGKHQQEKRQELWFAWDDLLKSPGHPFYKKLNGLLSRHSFDAFCQEKCKPFYAANMDRPSLPPEMYFLAMIVGYFV
ncbi:MAG: hypothetical protein ACP5I1_16850 [Candidatus Hinthialibacter sp.]